MLTVKLVLPLKEGKKIRKEYHSFGVVTTADRIFKVVLYDNMVRSVFTDYNLPNFFLSNNTALLKPLFN